MSSGKGIRHGLILQALREQHNGCVTAGGNTDAANKLLRTLTLHNGQRSDLCALLRQMATDGQIVIETSGNRFETIALPNATIPEPESEEAAMAAPKGMNLTCSPRTADGHDLPSRLTDDMVSPVVTSYVSPQVEQAVVTTAELVIDELRKVGKTRMGRADVLALIEGVVVVLHDTTSELAKLMADQVFSYLVSHRYLLRDSASRQKEAVYELRLPELPVKAHGATDEAPPTQDKLVEQLNQLVKIITGLEKKNAALTSELESAKSIHVDPAILEQLTENLELANAKVEDLQRQLEEAAKEQERTTRAHEGELDQLRAQHADEVLALQQQLETELAGRTSEVSAELRARWEKLGIKS